MPTQIAINKPSNQRLDTFLLWNRYKNGAKFENSDFMPQNRGIDAKIIEIEGELCTSCV
jgi:hypothetical protein